MTDEKFASRPADAETRFLHQLTGQITSQPNPFTGCVITAVYRTPEGKLRVGASACIHPSTSGEVYELLADRLAFLAGEMRQGPPRGNAGGSTP